MLKLRYPKRYLKIPSYNISTQKCVKVSIPDQSVTGRTVVTTEFHMLIWFYSSYDIHIFTSQ